MNKSIIPLNTNFYNINNLNRNFHNINNNQHPSINKIELYTSVSAEIDRIISNLTVKYVNNNYINETDKIILLGSIENKFRESIGIYKKWLDVDFLQFFENSTSLSKYSNIIKTKEVIEILSCFVENKQINNFIFE